MRTPTRSRPAVTDRLEVRHPPGGRPVLVTTLLVLALLVAIVVTVSVVLILRAAGGGVPSAPGLPGQTLVPQPVPGPAVRA